jgi:hypothetical protein
MGYADNASRGAEPAIAVPTCADLAVTQRQVNASHASGRRLGERAMATLKPGNY